MALRSAGGYVERPIDFSSVSDVQSFLWVYRRAVATGKPHNLFAYYDSMLRTPEVRSNVELRRAGMSGSRITLQAGGAGADAQANLERFEKVWSDTRFDVRELVSHLSYSLPFYGVGLAEIEWATDGRELIPLSTLPLHDRAVAWTATGIEELLVRTGPNKYERLRPDRWIVAQSMTSGSYADMSLMRPTTILAMFAIQGWASWVRYVDHYAVPVPIVEVSDMTDEMLVAAARELCSTYGQHGYVLGRDDKMKLTVNDAMSASRVGTSDVQARFIKGIESSLAKMWNGGDLVQGSGDKGSHALGSVHKDAKAELYGADAQRIARAIDMGMIEPYFRLNGISGPRPTVSIVTSAQIQNLLSEIGYLAQNKIRPSETGVRQLSQWVGIDLEMETDDVAN